MSDLMKYLIDGAAGVALFMALAIVFLVDFLIGWIGSGPAKNTLENVKPIEVARSHGGKCKACFTGEAPKPKDISNHPLLCPTCRERLRTAYQKAHGYHCDSCTKQADPAGHYFETTGHFPMM